MIILAVDVQYDGDGPGSTAKVAGMTCEGWSGRTIKEAQVFPMENIAAYEPGAFYKRELPCILRVLDFLQTPPDIIIVDGYVDLGPDHPGLGRHLFNALGGKTPVVGVAKTAYVGAPHVEVSRGSKKPLYVTAAGMDVNEAANNVQMMHGPYRIPDLLKAVDGLARRP